MGLFSSGGDLTIVRPELQFASSSPSLASTSRHRHPRQHQVHYLIDSIQTTILHSAIMFRATSARMATFQNKKFRSSADTNQLGMKYRALMNRHPFLMFGLPFLGVIISGSFVLTPATAVRYEKHDRKVRQMTKEEELNVRRSPRKVDMREEYYVSAASLM